jgi:hypothetical protein
MLVQRRIQEEIHGNKTISNETRPTPIRIESSPVEQTIVSQDCQSHVRHQTSEQKSSNGRRSQVECKGALLSIDDLPKRSSNTSIDLIESLTDVNDEHDDLSTNEIVARNQSKSDFHQTMTPM